MSPRASRWMKILSGFYERISTPVLTNLALDFGSGTYDYTPTRCPTCLPAIRW
jgi:hypothetical protein